MRRAETNTGKERRTMQGLSVNEKRARRKKARHRIVMMQRVFLFLCVLAVIGGGAAIIWNLPVIRLNRELKAGEGYTQEEAYGEAIDSYENALKIDSTSVKAYRYMAKAYFDLEDDMHAKQVLLEGWENTQDEGLLQYYCTAILNEAVAEINAGQCTLETAQKILGVLKRDSNSADALPLMHTVYERITSKLREDESKTFFLEEREEAEFGTFNSYIQIMKELIELYAQNPSEEIKTVISQFAMVDVPEFHINREHLKEYKSILDQVNSFIETDSRSNLILCLEKEAEVQAIFADLFLAFDAGNLEAAKEFIISDTYTGIRDSFINGTMEYWTGATYIPVSREYVILRQENGAWAFEYPDFKANENTAGIITVWGAQMKDDGVQRSAIAYEPAKESESYYPHTEYVISYMYSNVQKKNAFEAEMNYHLETRSFTEVGMTTIMIGDWGGPYQWQKTY